MVNVMVTFEGLNVEQLQMKFISMGYNDGGNVFDITRVQLGVITQMKENVIPFIVVAYPVRTKLIIFRPL
jgi:hypothetical protein